MIMIIIQDRLRRYVRKFSLSSMQAYQLWEEIRGPDYYIYDYLIDKTGSVTATQKPLYIGHVETEKGMIAYEGMKYSEFLKLKNSLYKDYYFEFTIATFYCHFLGYKEWRSILSQ